MFFGTVAASCLPGLAHNPSHPLQHTSSAFISVLDSFQTLCGEQHTRGGPVGLSRAPLHIRTENMGTCCPLVLTRYVFVPVTWQRGRGDILLHFRFYQ